MKYYTINEDAARSAHHMNHMSDYTEGSTTSTYRNYVDVAYAAGEERKAKYPEAAERIDYLCNLYARKLANWYNESFRIELMCPSVMISGASNFPVHKKEKQNKRRDSHWQEWEHIQGILHRIDACGSDAIKSDDECAIEKLELKIEQLTEEQEIMKTANAYYRKNKTLDDCPVLTEEEIGTLNAEMAKPWRSSNDSPFSSYTLTNNNANIRRLKERVEQLKKIKSAGTQEHSESETGIEGLTIVENTEAMRIQLIFNGKPDEETRILLKSWGFKWSPHFTAWQRMLNSNGKYAAKKVVEELRKKDT